MGYSDKDTTYKRPFGAVKTGEEVYYRIAPKMPCDRAAFVLWEDGKGTPARLPMAKTENGFELRHIYEREGVYFYNFELSDGSRIYKNTGGEPIYSHEGEAYQQTVYAADYVQPKGFAGGVMYQIFPDRFHIGTNGVLQTPFDDRVIHTNLSEPPVFLPDENGEVRNRDYFGGNLRGIEEKLPYLESLGVTCMYLNPICESHSNHRYDTACYRRVDPLLGTEDDFKRLCAAAHKKGMTVVLDGVFSHTGADSEYFNKFGRYNTVGAFQSKDSPYYSWFKFHEWPHNYQSWWGFDILPEIIEEDPEFARYITGVGGVVDYWMQLGADGFRLDVADELPDLFIEKIREAVKRHGDDKILIGEVWEDASNKVSYGMRRRYLYGHELDAVMNYPFRNAILDFIKRADAGVFMAWVSEIVSNYPKPMLDVMMNLLSTHDTERAINILTVGGSEGMNREQQSHVLLEDGEYMRGVEMLKLAVVLQFTLPGLPCIYYGDEIGMQGMRDPFNRAYMKWDVADQNLLAFVQEISRIRKTYPVFADGAFVPLYAANATVAFMRQNEEHRVAVALNRSERAQTIALPNGETMTIQPWSYAIQLVK